MSEASGGAEPARVEEQRRTRLPARAILRVVVIAVVAWLAWRFARGLAWSALADQARQARPLPLLAVALLCVVIAPIKAARARLMLAPFADLSTRKLSGWYLASWAADNLLMSQAGIGVRLALLRAGGVPLLAATAQQALEKLLDAAGLLLLVPLAGGALVPPSWMALAARWPSAIAAALAILIGLGVWAVRRPEARHVFTAARVLARPRVALTVAVLTVSQWIVEVAMLSLLLSALALPWSLAAAARGILAVNVAALVPGLPANLGTFEAAATAALLSSGIAAGPALGAALLYHALHTAPVTLLGLSTLRRVLQPAPARAAAA